MYGIYNKDGNRLYQFGTHHHEESANRCCLRAREMYPKSGAHVRFIEPGQEINWKARLTDYLMSFGTLRDVAGNRRIALDTNIRIDSVTTVECVYCVNVNGFAEVKYRYRIDGYRAKVRKVDNETAERLYGLLIES